MSDRVKDDPSLKDRIVDHVIEHPVLIVEKLEGDGMKLGVTIQAGDIDPNFDQPKLFGIILSDVLDHIASMYSNAGGRDARDVRNEIMKIMRDEDRFKDKDPSRGGLRGTTIKPQMN